MKFKEGIPSRKGLYLMTTAAGHSLRLVRIRGLDNPALQSDPGVYGGKIYEFLSIGKREWVRFEVATRNKETLWSPRIRQAVGFGLEPQEPNEPVARQVVITLTHDQSLDEDLTSRIKAGGACWKVDMMEVAKKEFIEEYKEISKGNFMCNLASTHTPGRTFAADATEMAWRMFKRVKGIK